MSIGKVSRLEGSLWPQKMSLHFFQIGSPTPENDGNDEVNLSGLSEMEKYVMEHTNCMDPINVRQALEDNEYDVEATVDFLNVLYRCRKPCKQFFLYQQSLFSFGEALPFLK